MTATQTGMAVGAVLAIVALVFGFWGFLLAAIAIAIGALVGRIVDGTLDVSSLLEVFRGKRVSS